MTLIDALLRQATQTNSPISATFELTARCNFSCKMCYIHNLACDKEIREKELSTQAWLDIAKQAKDAGTLILLLTGGEPLIREDFGEIYRACVESGFLVTINSNGSLITEEIFELFREHPPLRINISLYGMSRKIYEDLCGNGAAFDAVLRNLRRLRSMNIPVQLNFTASPYNQAELADAQRFANEIGAVLHYTSYLFPPTRTALPCEQSFSRFTPEEAAEAAIEYLRISHGETGFAAYCRAKAKEAPSRSDDCGEIYDGVRCRAGRASYWITYEGNMLPCGMLSNFPVSVPQSGFAQAWKETVLTFAKVKSPAGCLACPDYERCEVCPAVCFCEKDDLSQVPEYICQKNRHYRKRLCEIADALEAEK